MAIKPPRGLQRGTFLHAHLPGTECTVAAEVPLDQMLPLGSEIRGDEAMDSSAVGYCPSLRMIGDHTDAATLAQALHSLIAWTDCARAEEHPQQIELTQGQPAWVKVTSGPPSHPQSRASASYVVQRAGLLD